MLRPVVDLSHGNRILQITFPAPRNLRGSVSAYIITDGADWSVVDTGWDSPNCLTAWEQAVQSLGLAWRNLRQVVLTHGHWDHAGQAMELATGGNCPVLIHAQAGAEKERRRQTKAEVIENAQRSMTAAGLADPHAEDMFIDMPDCIWSQLPAQVQYLTDDSLVECGSCTLSVLHTPGHTTDHICLLDTRRRFVLTGDLVLQDVFTAMDTFPGGPADPLGQYLNSLSLLSSRDMDFALPGHRPPFSGLGQRIEQIRTYHAERIAGIRRALIPGASNAANIAKELEWYGRTFAELSAMGARGAVGEVMVKLKYLAAAGDVTVRTDGEVLLFERVAGIPVEG